MALKDIEITPSGSLTFTSNFLQDCRQELAITNVTKSVVGYKMKTTSPDIIVIRPGYGYIQPDKMAKIAVIIRSMPPDHELPKRAQRLSILFAFAPKGRPSNPYKFWQGDNKPKEFWKTSKNIILQKEATTPSAKEAKDSAED